MNELRWKNTLERLKNLIYFIHGFSTGNDFHSYAIPKLDFNDQLVSIGNEWAHFLPTTQFLTEIGLTDETFEELKNKYDRLPKYLMEEIAHIINQINDLQYPDSDLVARLAELLEMALYKY